MNNITLYCYSAFKQILSETSYNAHRLNTTRMITMAYTVGHKMCHFIFYLFLCYFFIDFQHSCSVLSRNCTSNKIFIQMNVSVAWIN